MEAFSNNAWSAYFDDVSITEGASMIPEPPTYAVIFGGLALFGAFADRRRLGAKK